MYPFGVWRILLISKKRNIAEFEQTWKMSWEKYQDVQAYQEPVWKKECQKELIQIRRGNRQSNTSDPDFCCMYLDRN